MTGTTSLTKAVYAPAFVLGCFIVGLMVPTFYDWSGVDQSHSTPAADQAIWALVVFGILSWLVIPWLPMKARDEAAPKSKEKQINLRTLFVLTAFVAFAAAGICNWPVAFCILLGVVAFVANSRVIARDLSWKWQMPALLACMYFPYAWTIASGEFTEFSWSLIGGAIGLPSFLPALFLANMFDTQLGHSAWPWMLLTVVEVAVGFWLIRTGPRRTVAYFVLVMLMSVYGSFCVNALIRI